MALGATEWELQQVQNVNSQAQIHEQEVQASTSKLQTLKKVSAAITPLISPFPSDRFAGYELVEKIAQGGMGVVYKARQVNLNRIVALKLLPLSAFSQGHALQRFQAEAAAAASMQHPNIVAIHDVGEHEGQHFFSMDFVEGHTLAELVRDQPLRARRAAGYLKTIAQAVHYAHQKGILHRDLKPSNILIDAFDQPRITDFGVAKRLNEDLELTLTGQVLGSPNFISPEQAEGRPQNIGPPTDVYSLGALLYHLLTRQPPFQAETLPTLLKQVVETDPVPPRRLNPSIPTDLETICLKCLEKETGSRYLTAQAMAEDLERFLQGETILARPVGILAKVTKWCRRRPALAGMAAGLLTVFVLGLGGVLWQWQRATRMARAELQQRQRAQASEYAADMHLAQLALYDNNRALTLTLLHKYRPAATSGSTRNAPVSTDPRGWEWRYLWQLCQPDNGVTLHRYRGSIKALALSNDSRLLAVTTAGESALWDLVLKRQLALRVPENVEESRNPLLPAGTRALSFSPVAEILAIGARDESDQPVVDLWNVSPAEQTRKSSLPVGNLSLSFSPDGKQLAVLDSRGKVTITEWASGQTLLEFPVLPLRDARAGFVLFSPDGNQLAIAEEYGRLRLINLKTPTTNTLATQTGAAISALAFSPDSALLAAGIGYEQGTIRLWDTLSAEPRGYLTSHTRDVTAITFTPDLQRMISASLDGTIRIWRLTDLTEIRCLQTSREGVTSMALLADGCTLMTGAGDGSLRSWDITRTRPAIYTNLPVSVDMAAMSSLSPSDFAAETLAPDAARRFGVAFTPDSQGFVTMNRDGTLALWDAHSLRPLETLPLGSNHWAVALSPNGRWLATGDLPGRITLRDWNSRQAVTNFTLQYDWFGQLRFSPSSRYLTAAVGTINRGFSVRIWRTDTWEELPLSGSEFVDVCCLDVSPDDQLLAGGYDNGTLKVFRWPSGTQEWATNVSGSIFNVSFSRDGRLLATPRLSGTAQVWDVAARKPIAVLRGHAGMVPGAAFLPDGRRLVTGGTSARDAVKVWDLQTEREVLSLKADGYYFLHVACSPDGSTVTATSFNGTAHFWRVPSWEDIQAAENGVFPPTQ